MMNIFTFHCLFKGLLIVAEDHTTLLMAFLAHKEHPQHKMSLKTPLNFVGKQVCFSSIFSMGLFWWPKATKLFNGSFWPPRSVFSTISLLKNNTPFFWKQLSFPSLFVLAFLVAKGHPALLMVVLNP